MAAAKKRNMRRSPFPQGTIPDLVASALVREDDIIITGETDPETGRKILHVITGKLVTPCMLNKLKGQVEAYPEDGGAIVSGQWKC